MKIVGMSQGLQSPSSRFRVHKIEEYINASYSDIQMETLTSKPGSYPPLDKFARPAWLVSALYDSYARAKATRGYDVCLLHRELISTIPSFEKLIDPPIIFDVDDAIWLTSRFDAVRRIAELSQGLVAGNSYIADRMGRYFSHVDVVPTAVNSNYFKPNYKSQESTIVWSGSSSGFPYLYDIESSLKRVIENNNGWKIRIVSDKPPKFNFLSSQDVEFVRWEPKKEVSVLQSAAIGIMPLKDTEWERAKCSYKMLTYMSCGLPVVVSPVGMNADVLKMGEVGLPASSEREWEMALNDLISDVNRSQMGRLGREVIVNHFEISKIVSKLVIAMERVTK